MTEPDRELPQPGPDATLDELQADIERTRTELGQTTQALTDKLDVKQRASDAASDARDRVVEKAHDAKETVVDRTTTAEGSVKPAIPIGAVAIAAVAAIVGVIIWRRRR